MDEGESDGFLILKVATTGSPVLGTSGITDIVIGLAADLAVKKPSKRKKHSQVIPIFSTNPLYCLDFGLFIVLPSILDRDFI